MNDVNRERVESFIAELRKALAGSRGQTGEIVEEVRADLEAHVERLQSEGQSEEEAVTRALDEMGNPYELAHHVSGEIPPFGGKALTILRYVAASGVTLWTLFFLWNLRAWVYGFSPALVAIVVLFHLPVILLLWPRLVWRKNWMYGLIPAGAGLLLVLFATFAGMSNPSSGEVLVIQEFPSEEPGNPTPMVQPVEAPADSGPKTLTLILVAVGLGMVSIAILGSMQQRFQRRLAIVAVLLGAGSVEAVFQMEELRFREDRQRVRDYVEAFVRENGTYPSEEEYESGGPKLRSEHGRIRFDADRKMFSMFWSRPLSSGFSITYSSDDDQVGIQD